MKQWIERRVDESAVSALMSVGVSPITARLLALRGVTPETLDAFFTPDFRDLADPFELPGISEAVDIIVESMKAKEMIVVFGDYDCDGVCATSIITQVLRSMCPAKRIVPFLPVRMTEGYGLSEQSMARMFKEAPDVKLIITVDNGTTSVEQVKSLRERGIKVIITDHHLRGDEMPEANAMINPRVAAPEHLSNLCGAAVAYFLANALVARVREITGRNDVAGGISGMLFTLAGLATVTDIMPLQGQNRILVAEALKHFPRWAPVGLIELHSRVSRTGVESLTSRDFSFVLGPRINAVGRLASPMPALELIMSSDPERARELAMEVDLENIRRRKIEQGMTDAALENINPETSAQVISFSSNDENVHPGVAGIVASRLLERLPKAAPVCVVVDGKGSARAPEGYNVRDSLAACSEYLTTYGGHAAAAGLCIKQGCIDEFREKFAKVCEEQLSAIEPGMLGARHVDMWVGPHDLTVPLAEDIVRMEPFGEGNDEPVFALRGIYFAPSGLRLMGNMSQHLQVIFSDHAIPRGVWWNHGKDIERLRTFAPGPLDVLFSISLSEYGKRHVDMRVIDIRPTATNNSRPL